MLWLFRVVSLCVCFYTTSISYANTQEDRCKSLWRQKKDLFKVDEVRNCKCDFGPYDIDNPSILFNPDFDSNKWKKDGQDNCPAQCKRQTINPSEVLKTLKPQMAKTVTIQTKSETKQEIPYDLQRYAVRVGQRALQDINQVIASFMDKWEVPGLSIAIGKNGRILFATAYGYAQLPADTANGLGVQLRIGHLFRIASLSKPLTSTILMSLVEQKKLSLDDLAFKTGSSPQGILQVTPPPDIEPYLAKVKVRHLLEHSSCFSTTFMQDQINMTNSEFLQWGAVNYCTKIEPGTRYMYSNFGYFVLGRILEQKTGIDYEKFMVSQLESLFEGEEVKIGGATLADRDPIEVKYYNQMEPELPYSFNFRRLDSSAGWITSALGLLYFQFGLTPNSTIHPVCVREYLQDATRDLMLTPNSLITGDAFKVAMGWRVSDPENYWHSGQMPGTFSHMHSRVLADVENPNTGVLENSRYSYVVLMNADSFTRQAYMEELFEPIWKILKGAEEFSIPPGPLPIPTSRYSNIINEEDRTRVETLSRLYMEEAYVPGFSFAAAWKGKIVYGNGFGYADLERRKVVQFENSFRIASCSKSVTAILIMRLIEAGKFKLDDRVLGEGGLLGKFPGVVLNENHLAITVRHLLHHIVGVWGNQQVDPITQTPTLNNTDFERMILRHFPLTIKPGLQFQYSNYGFYLLGRIIEKFEGRDYESAAQSSLLRDLGACSMQVGVTLRSDKTQNEVWYYSTQVRENSQFINVPRFDSAGGLIASAEDLLRIMLAFDEGKLMKDSSRSQMLQGSSAFQNYGLGWFIEPSQATNNDPLNRTYFHSGNFPGANSLIYREWMQRQTPSGIEEGPLILVMIMNGNSMLNMQLFLLGLKSAIRDWKSESLGTRECNAPNNSQPGGESPVVALILAIVFGVIAIIGIVWGIIMTLFYLKKETQIANNLQRIKSSDNNIDLKQSSQNYGQESHNV